MRLKVDMAMRTDITEVLQQRADVNARLALIPYEGTPEIKERGGKRYLYMRKRVGGRLTSTYVDVYSEELHQLLLRNAAEARKLRKELRALEKQLAQLGYSGDELDVRVLLKLDFARANLNPRYTTKRCSKACLPRFGVPLAPRCTLRRNRYGRFDCFHEGKLLAAFRLNAISRIITKWTEERRGAKCRALQKACA